MRPTKTEVPEKRYFRIGEVSTITGLESYVLRYWETEFPKISPARSRAGQRLYRKSDIKAILQIKDLLYNKKFTIAGAKRFLQLSSKKHEVGDGQALAVEEIKAELMAIRDLLNR